MQLLKCLSKYFIIYYRIFITKKIRVTIEQLLLRYDVFKMEKDYNISYFGVPVPRFSENTLVFVSKNPACPL